MVSKNTLQRSLKREKKTYMVVENAFDSLIWLTMKLTHWFLENEVDWEFQKKLSAVYTF